MPNIPYSIIGSDNKVKNIGIATDKTISELKLAAGERLVANVQLPVGQPFRSKKVKPPSILISELQAQVANLEARLAALEKKVNG